MPLDTAQRATLKAHIISVPELNTLYVDGNLDGLAGALNTDAVPDYWVWRTAVPKHEMTDQVSQDGTSFIWAGNGFIGRTQGEISCWAEMFNTTLTCNPSLLNVRQAFLDIFSGTGNAANNRAHMLIVARRRASVVEKLFASGAGTTAAPSLMIYEGPIPYTELVGL